MKSYEVTRIGQQRGRPRIWLEGLKAKLAGFLPGKRFEAKKDEERKVLTLQLSDAGARIVSRKIKGDREVPVIDISSLELLSMFDGMEAVRIIAKEGKIFILPLASELAAQERLSRLKSKLENHEPISIGSISHGGGVLSHAIHAGLKEAGIESELVFANEIRTELLEQAAEHNDAWNANTIPLAAPIQELAFCDQWAMHQLPKVELLEAGLPCSGASVAGRAKNAISRPEQHPEVGHLIAAFIAIIAKTQPAVVQLENVKQYMTTASFDILRNQLRDFGYDVHETVLQASDWNSLEARERMCMVAVTKGLSLDFSALHRPQPKSRHIGEILDPIAEDDPRWSEMAGLKAKEIRDKEAGKGFAMQILTEFDTKCPTMTKGYAKIRSTDPKLAHRTNPNLLRQFTPAEHARLKDIPDHLITGLSATLAHELLGQSICYLPFKAVGKLLGEMFKSLDASAATPVQHCALGGVAG